MKFLGSKMDGSSFWKAFGLRKIDLGGLFGRRYVRSTRNSNQNQRYLSMTNMLMGLFYSNKLFLFVTALMDIQNINFARIKII